MPEAQLISLTADSTEVAIATLSAACKEDVEKAVLAARAALKHESWKKLSASDRGRLMSRLADLIEEQKDLLAAAWPVNEIVKATVA